MVYVCVYIYIFFQSTVKKKEILPFVTAQMDPEKSIMLSKVSQTEKDKCWMISLICEI